MDSERQSLVMLLVEDNEGHRILEKIKADPTLRSISVIMLTSTRTAT
jgi:hypothetical protein